MKFGKWQIRVVRVQSHRTTTKRYNNPGLFLCATVYATVYASVFQAERMQCCRLLKCARTQRCGSIRSQ